MKLSTEGDDGRSQSHIPVIPHSNCFTSVFFPAFRGCCSVSAASNESQMKDQPTVKKQTTKSRIYLSLTVQAPHFLCRNLHDVTRAQSAPSDREDHRPNVDGINHRVKSADTRESGGWTLGALSIENRVAQLRRCGFPNTLMSCRELSRGGAFREATEQCGQIGRCLEFGIQPVRRGWQILQHRMAAAVAALTRLRLRLPAVH
jgi:hypothetical protein